MSFENTLTEPTSPAWALRQHIPVLVIAMGVVALLISLHLAITGVIAIAAAHIVLGLVLIVVRRHRKDNA